MAEKQIYKQAGKYTSRQRQKYLDVHQSRIKWKALVDERSG